MNRTQEKKSLLALGILVSAVGLFGCTKADEDAITSGLGVSGTLSLGNSSQTLSKIHMMSINGDRSENALAVTDYIAVCATTTAPILSASSPVSSDGSFSISITGAAAGVPISCYLTDSNGVKQADFLVEDSSSKDLNGNNERVNTIVPAGNLSMGSITLDAGTGEVTVPGSNIASSISTAVTGTVFDPTGTWTIASVDFTLPNGVRSACTAAEQSAGTCHGPPEGMALYFKKWAGTKTSDGSAVHGLQLWESESGFTSCGSRIGLSTASKTQIGVDFSSNGAADAEFSFASSVANFTDQVTSTTGTVNLTDNWKMDTARSQWPINTACGPANITIGNTTYSNAWKCGPDTSGDYQVGIGGGCTNAATGANVELNNWSGLTCGSTATDADGIKSITCTGSANINGTATNVSCVNKWAVVNASNVVQPSGDFNWSEMSTSEIAANTLCSSIASGASSDALKIAQLQCYSNYYWMSGMARSSSCLPKIDADWSSSDPATFIKKNFRPNQLVFFEQFKPFPDGSGGSMLTREEYFRGVQVSGNSWVNCHVVETGGLTIKKISDTKLLATYQSSEVTSSTSKPACLAEFTGSKKTFIFYMNK